MRTTLPSRDAVPRVDGGRLADGDVLGLRLGNAEHRLEPPGLHDPRERGAALGPLPDFERQLLEDAVGAGHHDHRADAAALELVHVAEPVDLRLLQAELRVGRLPHDVEALLLDLVPRAELLDLVAGAAGFVGGDELLGGERLGRLGVALGIEVGGARAGDLGFLGEALRRQIGVEIHLFRPRDGELTLRLQRLELDVRVAQLEQHGLRLHFLTGLGQAPLHPPRRHRGDVPDALGDERARTPHLDHQRAALDGVDPDRGPVHARRRRLEAVQAEGGQHDREDAQSTVENLFPASFGRCPRYVHAYSLLRAESAGRTARPDAATRKGACHQVPFPMLQCENDLRGGSSRGTLPRCADAGPANPNFEHLVCSWVQVATSPTQLRLPSIPTRCRW